MRIRLLTYASSNQQQQHDQFLTEKKQFFWNEGFPCRTQWCGNADISYAFVVGIGSVLNDEIVMVAET